MQISFLIVTRNRPEDLRLTLSKLERLIDQSIHEVRVCIDDCLLTEAIISDYTWVHWHISKEQLSASPARNVLYKKAKGAILIGLDDDAHPISPGFIDEVEVRFRESENLAIIAFQEVRGLFSTDHEALLTARKGTDYYTNEFVGCGFAIKKGVYDVTRGFPVWMDIYGEETAVAVEVLDAGYDILYAYDIQVNHRVDVERRKSQGRNYYRFERQLKNAINYYIVYQPWPLLKIIKLLYHNFRKYALKDGTYFKLFVSVCFNALARFPYILRYRKPLKKTTIERKQHLQGLKF